MRLLHTLAVLAATLMFSLGSTAFAGDRYQVELLLIRQNQVPAIPALAPPEDWANGTPRLTAQSQTGTRLNSEAAKLQANSDYTVLLHKAWEQELSDQPSKIAIAEGPEHYGQFPVEGTLSLTLGRFTDVEALFWVNQFDSNGLVSTSERLKQSSRTKNGELNFLDNGHLALMLKVTSLSAPPARPTPDDRQD